jgi:methionyl-tRNA formyltransferase
MPIPPDANAGDVHDRLMRIGADLMARALAALERGSLTFTAQAETGITYAAKITKEECRIDFTRPAREIHDRIRGLAPFPGAFLEFEWQHALKRVKVLRAECAEGAAPPGIVIGDDLTIACGEGAIRLIEVQPAGKAPMSAAEFLNGHALKLGARVG